MLLLETCEIVLIQHLEHKINRDYSMFIFEKQKFLEFIIIIIIIIKMIIIIII